MLMQMIVQKLIGYACPAIKNRLRKEVLGEEDPYQYYRDAILTDDRVQYALSWQNEDGYFGDVFHGGWIPKQERRYCSRGAESALRFLYEMGLSKNELCIARGLNALLDENWNRGRSCWNLYYPEIGLYGDERLRACIFAYFGIEDMEFIKSEIDITLDILKKTCEVESIDEVIYEYKGKKVYQYGKALPEIYHIRLLAYTSKWRNKENLCIAETAIRKLIQISPLPEVLIKYKSQLIAPARIYPRNLKLSLRQMNDNEWFEWFHTFELFARMGMVGKINVLRRQADELIDILNEGKGMFSIKLKSRYFHTWGTYSGLALESDWKGEKWIYDLTFRSILILKYAGLLEI